MKTLLSLNKKSSFAASRDEVSLLLVGGMTPEESAMTPEEGGVRDGDVLMVGELIVETSPEVGRGDTGVDADPAAATGEGDAGAELKKLIILC